MKGPLRWYLSFAVVLLTAGCGPGEPSGGRARTESNMEQRETGGRVDEEKAVGALRELGANIACDAQGRVKSLRLSGPKITDAALEHVARLTNLQFLYLIDTSVTDAGFRHLEPLAQLKTLHRVSSGPEQLVVRTLKENSQVECVKTPVDVILKQLEEMHAVSIRIVEGKSCTFSRGAIVTTEMRNVSFGEVLTSILQPLGAAWTIEPQGIVVFSKECAATKRPQLIELQRRRPDLKDVFIDW